MQPHPTDHPGLIRLPGPSLTSIDLTFRHTGRPGRFNPGGWPKHPLAKSAAFAGWWEIDLDLLGLTDGDYEYEFVLGDGTVVADPYADRITRFGGYRGVYDRRLQASLEAVRLERTSSNPEPACRRTMGSRFTRCPSNGWRRTRARMLRWWNSAPLTRSSSNTWIASTAMGINCIETAADRGLAADAELGLRHAVFLRAGLRHRRSGRMPVLREGVPPEGNPRNSRRGDEHVRAAVSFGRSGIGLVPGSGIAGPYGLGTGFIPLQHAFLWDLLRRPGISL